MLSKRELVRVNLSHSAIENDEHGFLFKVNDNVIVTSWTFRIYRRYLMLSFHQYWILENKKKFSSTYYYCHKLQIDLSVRAERYAIKLKTRQIDIKSNQIFFHSSCELIISFSWNNAARFLMSAIGIILAYKIFHWNIIATIIEITIN